MSLLSIPIAFVNGGLIQASDHNTNMSAIQTWANGNITDANLTTLTGMVSWLIATNVSAISINSGSNLGQITLNQTGILAAGQFVFSLQDNAIETLGTAIHSVTATSVSTTIPVCKVSNAGTGDAESIAQTGLLAVGKEAHGVSVSGAQVTGRSASYVELTNAASSIPLVKGLNSGTGDLLDYAGASGRTFNVDNSGRVISTAPFSNKNFIINGAFDFFQRGTSVAVSNATAPYIPDRWYINCAMGTGSLITVNQNTSVVVNGQLSNVCYLIFTAPTAAKTTVQELWYTLPNEDSQTLYNQTVSLQCFLQALGNVSQVGVQLFTKSTEGKVASSDTALGSETLVTVNTSSYLSAKLEGQAIGTAHTTSGVVAIRIRVTAVSSGFIYDTANGFKVGQVSLNIGKYAQGFRRYADSFAGELQACQRFYEKSYDRATSPGSSNTTNNQETWIASYTSNGYLIKVPFKATKRITPIFSIYSPATGTLNYLRDISAGTDIAVASINGGDSGVLVGWTFTSGHQYTWQWAADAELT